MEGIPPNLAESPITPLRQAQQAYGQPRQPTEEAVFRELREDSDPIVLVRPGRSCLATKSLAVLLSHGVIDVDVAASLPVLLRLI